MIALIPIYVLVALLIWLSVRYHREGDRVIVKTWIDDEGRTIYSIKFLELLIVLILVGLMIYSAKVAL